jgi:hypothetical protein
MENPHEAEQAVLLERIIKNVVSGSLIPKPTLTLRINAMKPFMR